MKITQSDLYIITINGIIYGVEDLDSAEKLSAEFGVPFKYSENSVKFDRWAQDEPDFEDILEV